MLQISKCPPRFRPDAPDVVPWVTVTDFGCAKDRWVEKKRSFFMGGFSSTYIEAIC